MPKPRPHIRPADVQTELACYKHGWPFEKGRIVERLFSDPDHGFVLKGYGGSETQYRTRRKGSDGEGVMTFVLTREEAEDWAARRGVEVAW